MRIHFETEGASGIRVTSEFADILVDHDDDANGCRLRVTDLRTDRTVLLDALALEALTRAPATALVPYIVADENRHTPTERHSVDV
jgi:hypothetical protein